MPINFFKLAALTGGMFGVGGFALTIAAFFFGLRVVSPTISLSASSGAVLIGICFILAALQHRARVLDALSEPVSSINVVQGGPTRIRGRVVPTSARLVNGPLSGQPVVWSILAVIDDESRGDVNFSSVIHTEITGGVFLLDDGSGERACVRAEFASSDIKTRASVTDKDDAPRVRALMDARRLTHPGADHSITCEERSICPGELVCARGPSQRERSLSGSGEGSAVGSTELVLLGVGDPNLIVERAMFTDGRITPDLCVTNKSDGEIAKQTNFETTMAVVAGAVAVVVGTVFGVQ